MLPEDRRILALSLFLLLAGMAGLTYFFLINSWEFVLYEVIILIWATNLVNALGNRILPEKRAEVIILLALLLSTTSLIITFLVESSWNALFATILLFVVSLQLIKELE